MGRENQIVNQWGASPHHAVALSSSSEMQNALFPHLRTRGSEVERLRKEPFQERRRNEGRDNRCSGLSRRALFIEQMGDQLVDPLHQTVHAGRRSFVDVAGGGKDAELFF